MHPFKLADIGEGIAEVELMKWFVKVSEEEPGWLVGWPFRGGLNENDFRSITAVL